MTRKEVNQYNGGDKPKLFLHRMNC